MILILKVLVIFWYYAVKLFGVWIANALVDAIFDRLEAVSYTHLTLPTIYSV